MNQTTQTLAAIHASAVGSAKAWSASEFADLLSSNGVLAVGDDHAFALIRAVADEAEVIMIATHMDHQRQGHGRAVLDLAEQAVADPVQTVFLEVSATNHAARALYLGAGYELAGRRPGYYRDLAGRRTDALIMRKNLT